MMLVRDDTHLVGEVHCLNCGRTLAEAVRNPESGKLRLRPASNQARLQVTVIEQRLLRCDHCLGKAFLEPILGPGLQLNESGRNSLLPLMGAA